MVAIMTRDSVRTGDESADLYILGPQPGAEDSEYHLGPAMVMLTSHNERHGLGQYPRREYGEDWLPYYERCERHAVKELTYSHEALCLREDADRIDVAALLRYVEMEEEARRPVIVRILEALGVENDGRPIGSWMPLHPHIALSFGTKALLCLKARTDTGRRVLDTMRACPTTKVQHSAHEGYYWVSKGDFLSLFYWIKESERMAAAEAAR